MQRVIMAAMIPVSVESKKMVEESKVVSISINDRRDKKDKLTDRQDELWFLWWIRATAYIILTDYLIFLCLYALSGVQVFARISKFQNSSDPAVEKQFDRIRISSEICPLVMILGGISFIFCVCGPRGLIKILRRLTWLNYAKVFSLSFSLTFIIVCIVFPSKKAQMLVTTVFQDDYSPSHLPHSSVVLEIISIVFAIQHVILLFNLNRHKPPHFDLFRSDTEQSPPPYEEVDKAMLRQQTPPLVELSAQAEENIQGEALVQP